MSTVRASSTVTAVTGGTGRATVHASGSVRVDGDERRGRTESRTEVRVERSGGSVRVVTVIRVAGRSSS